MRILEVNWSDPTLIGGINNRNLTVSRILAARGHDVTMLSINPGQLSHREIIAGAKIVRLDSSSHQASLGFSLHALSYLRRLLRSRARPDIVNVHSYGSLLSHEVALLCRLGNCPFIYSPHYNPNVHILPGAAPVLDAFDGLGRLALSWSEAVVCISAFERDNVCKHFDIGLEKVAVIPNGVPEMRPGIKNAKPDPRSDLMRMLYVGCLVEWKGIQHVIETLRELVAVRNLNVILSIAGSGEYEPRLREQSRRLGVEDRIKWRGELRDEELVRLYRESDVLLLLSKGENYGTVVPEALSQGTPVIVTTTNTALAEFIEEPGCYGVTFPPSAVDVADRIEWIMTHDIVVGPFSGKIRTWEHVARDYEALYESLLEKRVPRRTSSGSR